MKKPRVAVISLLPNLGHVRPVLRVGDYLANAGFEVEAFLPNPVKKFVEEFSLTKNWYNWFISNSAKSILVELSAKSYVYNSSAGLIDVRWYNHSDIFENIANHFDEIRSLIVRYNPDIIIGDSNGFEAFYSDLALATNAKLLRHNCMGSYDYLFRRYNIWFGNTVERSDLYMTSVEKFAALFQLFVKLKYFLIRNRDVRYYKRQKTKALSKLKYEEVDQQNLYTAQVNTGIAPLELEYASYSDRIEKNPLYLGPLGYIRDRKIPKKILSWIKLNKDKKIVLVSFGSDASANKLLLLKIARGLAKQDAAVIWKLSEEDQRLVETETGLKNILTMSFLPQPELLKLPEIACFLAHGGSSGIQESLIGGIPMICMPFIGDQGYNASAIEEMGVGIRLWPHKFEPDEFDNVLQKILYDPQYKARALEMSEYIREQNYPKQLEEVVMNVAKSTLANKEERQSPK